MSDIVIPEGDYVEIVKPICINPFGDYFINIKRGSRLRLSKDLKIGDKYAICILTSYEKYGKNVKGEIDCGVYVPDVVSWSITIADRIIEAMRGVKNA